MLDENLPTFFIKPSTENPKFQSTYFCSQGGEEFRPSYSIRHLDPASPASRNRYAVGIYDSFCPDILYAEVLLIPKWTQPSLSQEAIRQNGGVPPPPEPILPTEFVIQLYNPDQQVLVRHKPKTWNTAASWEFEMPQETFRQPSNSALDRTLNDPFLSDTTPKLKFNWRKDGKLSKDMGCYLSGRTVDPEDAKKKSKEPDITVAIFKGLREITLYEPNFYRVEMEDFKGLEVVLLLGAIAIRDIYFGHMKEKFHISDPPTPTSSSPTAVLNRPPPNTAASHNQHIPPQQQQKQQQRPVPQAPPPQPPRPVDPTPPPADPRTQWEIDAESRRLKQEAESEARERRKKEKEAEKRTKKLLEAEKKAARKRQEQIDQETERLKKLFGKEDQQYRTQRAPTANSSNSNTMPRPTPPQRPAQPNPHHGYPSQSAPVHRPNAPQRPQSQFFAPMPTTGLRPPGSQPQPKEKRSFFGLRLGESSGSNHLSKKRSSMF